ncbi:hypothetical protein DL96DRAFT_1626934 [Flagelloscypha sp. PMI_526]|nr:hypothetical protein DL96DRAFT_1626934 [Flagelloscypha sp. PMI_526]
MESVSASGSSQRTYYKCAECEANFNEPKDLDVHRRTKCQKTVKVHYKGISTLTRSSDGLFHCPHCPYTSERTTTIGVHSKSKTCPGAVLESPKLGSKRKKPSHYSESNENPEDSAESAIPDNLRPYPPFHDKEPTSSIYPELFTIRVSIPRISHTLPYKRWPYRRGTDHNVRIDYFKHIGYGEPPEDLLGISGDLYFDFTTSDHPLVYIYDAEASASRWIPWNQNPVIHNDRSAWLGVPEHPIGNRYLWATPTKGIHWSGPGAFYSSSLCSTNDDRPTARDVFTKYLCHAFKMLSEGMRYDRVKIITSANQNARKEREGERRQLLRNKIPVETGIIDQETLALDGVVRVTRNQLSALSTPHSGTPDLSDASKDQPQRKRQKLETSSQTNSTVASVRTNASPPPQSPPAISIPIYNHEEDDDDDYPYSEKDHPSAPLQFSADDPDDHSNLAGLPEGFMEMMAEELAQNDEDYRADVIEMEQLIQRLDRLAKSRAKKELDLKDARTKLNAALEREKKAVRRNQELEGENAGLRERLIKLEVNGSQPMQGKDFAELQAMYEKEKASRIESESKFDNLKRVLSDQLR